MKFSVQKSTIINAPVSKVRPLVEDFRQWHAWSPWTVIEPNCPITIQGQAGAVGHTMEWDGDIIGAGKNTIRAATKEGLFYDLAFYKPWKSKADTRFLFRDLGDQTEVTWAMNSRMPLFLFFMAKTMRNWVGMDYERGLRMLKEIAETGEVGATTTNSGVIAYTGFSYVGLQRTVAVDDLPSAMQEDFQTLVNLVVLERQTSAMHWVAITTKFDMRKLKATYIAAVSDENLADADLGPKFIRGQIEDARMLEVKHDGSYEFLGNAWSMGMMSMRAKKYKAAKYPFEQYWNSPLEESPHNLKTSVFFPLKG